MHGFITKEIQEATIHKQQLTVLRDSNTKVGTKIQGSKEIIPNERRLL